MAGIPMFIVIKPVICTTYVCYQRETEFGQVFSKGESVFNPYTKIELEQAKNNRRYYNLRFCQSNRYWAKSATNRGIVAVSKQTEEDTSKSSCTLFMPTINGEGFVRQTHVQSGIRVQTDKWGCFLYLDEDGDKGRDGERYRFTYVDWESIVKIPKRVAFRGDNGKILRAVWCQRYPYLQFSSTDGNDGYSAQEVRQQPDGHLRIKSEYYSKFWRRSPNWIWGDSSDESGNNVNTLFWPVKVDSRTIALHNAGNNMFVKRLSIERKTSCLNASAADISIFAKLVVEELVLESNVYNVRYRMEDARVFDEQPYLAGVGTAINESDTEDILTVKIVYQVTDSSSFTNSSSLKLGVKTTFVAKTPLIFEGKIDTSIDVTYSSAWGSTQTIKKSAEGSLTIKVPPKSVATVSYVGTHGKCNVPFSYTQKDTNASDGGLVYTYHNDGVYYGTNYYSFRFERPAVKPL